jgi:hypothetical protein
MVTIQPVRDFVRDLAGKQVRGESRSQRDDETLSGFASAFPDLENPIFVRCSVDAHTSWGVLVFADEMVDGETIGNIRFVQPGPVCTTCGDGRKVVSERVVVFRR